MNWLMVVNDQNINVPVLEPRPIMKNKCRCILIIIAQQFPEFVNKLNTQIWAPQKNTAEILAQSRPQQKSSDSLYDVPVT